ncbi:MAG: class I SAM-dependent methyltransferase [Bacteroidia bacterium]
MNLINHWNTVYETKEQETLGWYEKDTSKTWELINESGVAKDARVIHIGAGTTTLVDEMLDKGFTNMMATDLSKSALDKLAERVGADKIDCIVDDLAQPSSLKNIEQVDLWIDRAVLHFLTTENGRKAYFDLLKSKVKDGGYVILAQFALNGAEKCSGLPVYRYNAQMMSELLGADFELVNSFDHIYMNPGGAERPYVYALFKKNNS